MESLMALGVLVRVRDAFSGPLRQMAGLIDRNTRRLRELARGFRQFGRTALIAGGIGAAALGGIATTASGFEATMSRVGAVSRATQGQMAELRSTARTLGATTSFSASQAAEGMTFLAMAGFKTTKIIAAMPGVLDLARAGAADLATTADIASNILSGFGLNAGQIGRVGDVLTATFTTSNTDLRMLGETMKYVAPLANTLGVSLEEAAAMAGLLGNVGIQSSQAGTTLRGILSRIAAPEGPGKKTLRLLGINTRAEAGGLREIVAVLADLQKATKGLGAAGQAKVFKEVFGEEAFAGAMELARHAASGGLAEFVARNRQAQGETKRVAGAMGDNFAGAVKTLTSSLEAVTLTLGDQLLPLLKPMVEGLTEILRNFQQWSEATPGMVRNLAKFALWGSGLLFVLGGLATTLGVVAVALALLGGPVTLIIVAVGLLGAAVGALVIWWDEATAAMSRFFGSVKQGSLLGTLLNNAFGISVGDQRPRAARPAAERAKLPSFPDISRQAQALDFSGVLERKEETKVEIQNLNLPGVTNPQDFLEVLKGLSGGFTTAEAGG